MDVDRERNKSVREATLEKALCDYARKKEYLVYKFVSPQHKGVPDRIFISPSGQVVFIEVKAPGKKPTELQYREIKKLLAQGVPAYYCDSLATGMILLEAHK